jgi:hypothetical protein
MKTRSIIDSSKISIERPKIDLTVTPNKVKSLDLETANLHYSTLAKMLGLTSRLVYEKLPKDGGGNNQFQQYLLRLGETLEVLVLKNMVDAGSPNLGVSLAPTINPVESGYPLFVRDIYFLKKDKERSGIVLDKLPGNKELVDGALFSLFRGFFPRDLIKNKIKRNYNEELHKLDLPAELKIYPEIRGTAEDGSYIYKKSVERFDDHQNIPRFYTVYIKIPSRSYGVDHIMFELQDALASGLSVTANFELNNLARKIESINGMQLQMIERFDVGPFYNRNTDNSKIVQALLDQGDDTDSVMTFQRQSVIRIEEKRKEGVVDWFKGLLSGDNSTGVFSPQLSSPVYAIMPHRLIQKLHSFQLSLGNYVRMYGVTNDGGLTD